MIGLTLLAPALVHCIAIDGDTLRCGKGVDAERVRLIGIDAPELHGCRRGRVCVTGDPLAARRTLAGLVARGPARIDRHGTDLYGRTLAFVRVGHVDLSCAMLRSGQAVYVERWDWRGQLARGCR